MTAAPLPALYCASCGAPATSRVVGQACSYCHSPLVPAGHPHPAQCQRCRRCSAANDHSARFCGRCGHGMDPSAPQGLLHAACPGCQHEPMNSFYLLESNRDAYVAGCSNCGGCWLPHPTFEALKTNASLAFERQSEDPVPPQHKVKRKSVASEQVVYRSCPDCKSKMARRNFARYSGVIIDACPEHGTFFDAGELEDILDFVQSGGLALARERRRLTRAQHEAKARAKDPPRAPSGSVSLIDAPSDLGILIAWDAVCAFVHWAQDALERALDRE